MSYAIVYHNEGVYIIIRTRDGFVKTQGGYFVKTQDGYEAPNEEEQKVMTRLGYTTETLSLLNRTGIDPNSKARPDLGYKAEPTGDNLNLDYGKIEETRIRLLTPDYVRSIVLATRSASLWRASLLNRIPNGSMLEADTRLIGSNSFLRGVANQVLSQ